ncbi:MAG: M20/M25/M40 family metallo-hydrolase [candidate division Zixibacteria bacterium]|nr:M20/M25/M40 family metallo-hydrolase [candidate division Zixibacteria bacterium]
MKNSIIVLIALIVVIPAATSRGEDSELHYADSIKARFDADPALDSVIAAYTGYLKADSIASYIEQLTAFKTRFMLADNRRDIARFIGDKLASFGFEQVHIDSFQNTVAFPIKGDELHTTWQYNVAARMPGSTHPDDICILGAHYDCMILGPGTDPYMFCPGANNNASGVAVCLEIARIFKQMHFVPSGSIEFVAFGSEEFMTMFISGGSGAQDYVGRLKESGRNATLMIDNNQVSFTPDTVEWKLDFQNYPGAERVIELAHYICEHYTKIIPVDTNDHILYTDSRYFHEAGIPAIFFEEYYFNPYTFTADDIPANCNIAYCTEVARISCGMLVFLNR